MSTEKVWAEPTISSQHIYKGKVVNLRLDTVQLPGGNTTVREIVEHRDAVAIIALDAQDNVVLVRQFRKPVERALLEVPAGVIDEGESPEECTRRELQEETGFTAKRLERIGGFYSSPGFCTEYLHVFLATDLEPSCLDGDEDEDIEVVHIPLSGIPHLISSGAICDSKSVAGLLLALGRLARG